MSKRFLAVAVILSLINLGKLHAQTAGNGEIASIESLVTSYLGNKHIIKKYQEELPGLLTLWHQKIKVAKEDLASIYKERDNLIQDMKIGAKCSQCGKYKSEFEKEGKSFNQHLGEVKGYAIPATTAELEHTRKMFTEKIAIKKVAVQNLEKGDNGIIRLENQILELQNANTNICKKITSHSSAYEVKVLAEANSKQEDWMRVLLQHASDILIADDKITISNARILRLQEMLQKENLIIKDRVEKTNLKQQEDKNSKIAVAQQQIKETVNANANSLASLEATHNRLIQEQTDIQSMLSKNALADSSKITLTNSLAATASRIAEIKRNLNSHKISVRSSVASLERQINVWKLDIAALVTNLNMQQTTEIAKNTAVYNSKIADQRAMLNTRIQALASARKLYNEKADYFKKQNSSYLNLVVNESSRMVVAVQPISCAVYNEASFKVTRNWSKLFPCVNSLTTMAKPYSYNVFNSYCPGKSATSYMSTYKSFLAGLDREDLEAVRANSNVSWFEAMYQ